MSSWTAYIGQGKGIYIKQGSTSFASICDTGFVSKGKYVMGPAGSSYKGKNAVLTAIQRGLVRDKYKNKGCL